MGQDAEAALPLPAVVGLAVQGTPESPLVPGEGALGLPPLAEHPLVPGAVRLGYEPPGHLAPVLPARRAGVAAGVDRDDRRPDAQLVPGVRVVGLGVERGVRQHPVPADGEGRLGEDRPELRGVVGRAGGDGGPGDEVASCIDRDGELPADVEGWWRAPASGGEVPGRVATLQPGRIDRRRGPLADQAAVECGRGGAEQEDDELPFLRSRCSA